jgi:uncharacterized oxidoreductase
VCAIIEVKTKAEKHAWPVRKPGRREQPIRAQDYLMRKARTLAQLYPHEVMTRVGAALFAAIGAPAEEALLAAQGLTTSSLMGHDSHGVLRIPEYLDVAARGRIVPGAPMRVEYRSATTAVVDCGRNFGHVGAHRAMEVAMRLAREQKTACVITHQCNHVGRLGAYVQAAGEQDLIALATCNTPVYGHYVLPWGGKEGRLGTNPIAYAVPTGRDPILADMSTSVAPEGKLRFYLNEKKPVPPGWILDAAGRPTTDPSAFYGPPRGGILPLGGSAGHKGFALGLLVEILGSALAGIPATDPDWVGNGVCFFLIDPQAFLPLAQFKGLIDALVAYIKSSPPIPGVEEVLVPGELEYRTLRRRSVEGIPVDEVTWEAIVKHAGKLGVDLASLQTG